jgi:hypothetical protein
VRIALGSLAELETQVDIAIRTKLLDESAARSLRIELARTGKLLHGLRWTLRASTALTTLGILALFATASGLAWLGLAA